VFTPTPVVVPIVDEYWPEQRGWTQHLGIYCKIIHPSPGACVVDTANVQFNLVAILPRTVDLTSASTTAYIDGIKVYDGGAGGFQAGYTVGSSITDNSTALEDVQSFDINPATPFAVGTHTVIVDAVDDLGSPMATCTWTFCVEPAPPLEVEPVGIDEGAHGEPALSREVEPVGIDEGVHGVPVLSREVTPDSVDEGVHGVPALSREVTPESIDEGAHGEPSLGHSVNPVGIDEGVHGTPTVGYLVTPDSLDEGAHGEPVLSREVVPEGIDEGVHGEPSLGGEVTPESIDEGAHGTPTVFSINVVCANSIDEGAHGEPVLSFDPAGVTPVGIDEGVHGEPALGYQVEIIGIDEGAHGEPTVWLSSVNPVGIPGGIHGEPVVFQSEPSGITSVSAVLPSSCTIRGGCPVVAFLNPPQGNLASSALDKSFKSSSASGPWSAVGQPPTYTVAGAILNTGRTPNTISGLVSSVTFGHGDFAVDVLPLNTRALRGTAVELAGFALTTGTTPQTDDGVFITITSGDRADPNVVIVSAEARAAGQVVPGTAVRIDTKERVTLRVVRSGTRVWALVGRRPNDALTDEYTEMQELLTWSGFLSAATATMPLVYTRNLGTTQAVSARVTNFTLRSHVRVGERLLVNKVTTQPNRITGLVPATVPLNRDLRYPTVAGVGLEDIAIFSPFFGEFIDPDGFEYVLPPKLTLGGGRDRPYNLAVVLDPQLRDSEEDS